MAPAAAVPMSRVLAQAAKGAPPPIVVTRFEAEAGEDLIARDALVSGLTTQMLGDPPDLFGRTVIESPSVSLVDVLDAAREVSLLSPRRLVLVRGSRIAAGGDAQ